MRAPQSEAARRPPHPDRWLTSRVLFIIACLLLAVGCDQDDHSSPSRTPDPAPSPSPSPSPSPPGHGGPAVNIGRLGWEQSAPSFAELQNYRFVVFIDGAATSMASVECTNRATTAGFPCSGTPPAMSPGQRVIEMAAWMNGVQSSLSARLVVTVPTPATAETASATDAPVRSAQIRHGTCAEGASSSCFRVESTFNVAGVVTAIAGLPDGRLLALVDGRQARVLTQEGSFDEPALIVDSESERLTGVTLDPDFPRTSIVWIGRSRLHSDGTRSFGVSRYRELNGTLGEGAHIISDLPLESSDGAPFAVAPGALLYVSLPTSPGSTRARFPYAGFLLRYGTDGVVPTTSHLGSPILAAGYKHPMALAVDPVTSRIWIGARDPDRSGLAHVTPGLETRWPAIPTEVVTPSRTVSSVSALAIAADGSLWLLDQDARLYHASADASGRLRSIQPVPLPVAGRPVAIATCPPRSLCLAISDASQETSTILRLTRTS